MSKKKNEIVDTLLFCGKANFTLIFHTFPYTLSATQKLVSYTASGLSNFYVLIVVIIIIFPACKVKYLGICIHGVIYIRILVFYLYIFLNLLLIYKNI